MASPPSSTQTLAGKSHFKPTVTLYDWWLVKSEEKDQERRLAVAGVSSAPQEIPRRVFYSAPISKKYDVFTVETTDGVCVILEGLINKQETIANGFSDEIAKRFRLGFYPGWEKTAAEFLEGNSNATGVSLGISDSGSEGEGKEKSSPTSVHFPQEETPAPYEHIGSTYFPLFGRSKSLESNQKNLVSRCSMKHKSTKLFPSPDAFESVGGAPGAAVQSGEKMNELERCPSNSARRVTRFFSEFLRKRTNQEVVGNGLNFEKKATNSVITVSKTVTNSVQNDECEIVEEGVKGSSLTSLQLFLEEGSHEQVSGEDICDAEFPKQLSSELNLNNSIDDLVNHAVEEETDREDFRSTDLQSIGVSETLEENEKNPVSRCSIKHGSTNISPSVDVGVVVSGVTISFVGEIDTSKIYMENSGTISRSKGKKKQIAGSGLNSEQNTVDSVPALETVSNTSKNVDGGGRHMFESFLSCCDKALGLINSSPASVHTAHDMPNETVHCEDRLDVEDPKQISTNLSSDSTIGVSKVDGLINHAAEVELDPENIGLTEFHSVGKLQTREENEKNLASEPASEALEILTGALDANAQSDGKMDVSERSQSTFSGRVSVLFSGIIRRKGKKKQTVGNGMNSETNTIGSAPALSGCVSNPLENDSCQTVRVGSSDSELEEAVNVNVVRKLDFEFVEDDMQPSNEKQGQDFGNVEAQVGEVESGAKEEKKSRKRNMRKVTVDTQEIHFISETNKKKKAGVNKKKYTTRSTQEEKKKKDGNPEVNNKSKVSPSTLEVHKKTKATSSTLVMNSKKESSLSTTKVNNKSKVSPSTLEVHKETKATSSTLVMNSKKESSLSTTKVNTRKRKVSPSREGSKKRTSTPSTMEVNSKQRVCLTTPKVNTKKRMASPSTSEVSKKTKLNPSTLKVNNKKAATPSTPKVNMRMSIVSPESLSAGRSRSGRLRLPPLEFWRNQSAVYDKDHGVIGIQEELPAVTASRGITSEPLKRI